MYTLRTVKSNGREYNQVLGDRYQFIRSTSEGFKEIFEAYYNVNVYPTFKEDKVYKSNDPSCPFQGRNLTGDLNYDNKFFWPDVKEAYEKGYRYYFVEGEMHFLEKEDVVAPCEVSGIKGFICVGEDRLFPILRGDENYVMTESGRTFSNLTNK